MTNIKNVTTLDGKNVELLIDLSAHNFVVNNCKITAINMTAEVDGDEFYCGDLAVLWEAGDSNSAAAADLAQVAQQQLQRENDATATMGAFYWENEFDEQLTDLLQQNGFSAAAANDICTSEWGMQDVGRASYDANMIAEEMLAAHNIKFVECAY
mgnify:CR=1 FL=1|tara:strand:+ start:51 stop:515 length:465 start_codon:yes stop_codon:yes gene_type:complete